ncbi:MAG: EAL domain-containing protein [Pseudomonadota bacterium]
MATTYSDTDEALLDYDAGDGDDMTTVANRSAVDDIAPRMSWALDVFVICAVMLVAMAGGVALVEEVGAPVIVALLGAVALFVALLATHMIVRRAAALRGALAALTHLEAEVERMANHPVQARATLPSDAPAETAGADDTTSAAAPARTSATGIDSVSLTQNTASEAGAPMKPNATDAHAVPPPAAPTLGADLADLGPAVMPPSLPFPSARDASPEPPFASPRLGENTSPRRSDRDPRNDSLLFAPPPPPVAQAMADIAPAPPPPPAAPALSAADTRDADAKAEARGGAESAVIQSVLTRMAADISNAGTRLAPAGNRESGPSLGMPGQTAEDDDASPLDAAAVMALASAPTDVASLLADGANEATASAVEVTAPVHAAEARLAAVASALSKERVDLFLEPIKRLEASGAPHFEVKLRLRLDGEQTADRDAYTEEAGGTPLLPLIDTLAAARTRNVTWRVMQGDGNGRVFTAISGESLASTQFDEDIAAIFSGDDDTAKRIVLSFAQADARSFTEADRAALARLTGIGFSFAIDHVTDLDMDFDQLNDSGFEFVKLDADVFLDGLQVGMTRVPADDICRHLGSLGLTPIVGHIRDVSQLQKLKACGVKLGQGPLLGAPRALRADWFGAAS